MTTNLRIDRGRLLGRLERLARIGALPSGGVCRLALSDEDRAARDLVAAWMRELGLAVTVDRIGNIVGVRPGLEDGPPVMTGSHVDSVRTGGRFDGSLGVLAGLEVVATLNDAGIRTRRPLAVAAFTNEEGARFAPDMMGSMVHQGRLALDEALAAVGIDGATVGDELERIGYAGETEVGAATPACFVELHIEQGPILEREGVTIGAVEGVQGISWSELTIQGSANHAGTTPMDLRHDAGYVAALIAAEVRRVATEIPGQVGTVGRVRFEPDLINVIPERAVLTVDLRNFDGVRLREAEARLFGFAEEAARGEGVTVARRRLARFDPEPFDPGMIDLIEREAGALGHSVRRMPSGAGHDAQSFAPNCPTAMIFVPSAGGISHNVTEYTAPDDIEAGANVLLAVLVGRAEAPDDE